MHQTNNQEVTVAIVSDTHAWLDPRIAGVVKNADFAIHAGDIVDSKVLDELNALTGQVIAVAGNNDHNVTWTDDVSEDSQPLPPEAHLKLPGGCIAIEHGHRHGMAIPSHESMRATHPNARMIIYGHTHEMVCDTEDDPWIVNPGAAGRTRTNGGPSCLVLHAQGDEWRLQPHRFE